MDEIEEIDAIILKELLKDGRKSFTTIAQECHTSKDIIMKHYSKMKKDNIIVGATIQYNYPKFGYQALTSIQLNVESQHLDDVFERLTKISNIHPYRLYNSIYNIGLITTIRELKDLDKLKEMLKSNHQIISVRSYLWTNVRNTPENLTIGFTQNKEKNDEKKFPKKGDEKALGKLDEMDLQIVEALNNNGRAPFSRIAKTIGTSTKTVSRRYSKLVQCDLIKVSIQINPALLGFKAILNFFVSFVSKYNMEIIVESLSKIPNVTYILKISGDYDLQLAAIVKDIEEMYVINEEIMKIPNIGKIEADIRKIPRKWPGPKQYISTF